MGGSHQVEQQFPWETWWLELCQEQAGEQTGGRTSPDVAHDLAHTQRVVANARRIAAMESAELAVVIPAAWLHDCVNIPKDSPLRGEASRLAADRAVQFLKQRGFADKLKQPELLAQIHHAIHAHSYSANIECNSDEARVVQDADRLDALGAIGLARCLAIGAQLGLPLYATDDPFCLQREPNDQQFVIDHFKTKLLRLPETMQTTAGQQEASRRVQFLQLFLEELASEI